MSRRKEINLGRNHQIAVYRYARETLLGRPGGIILADGVGLGKTYEALATVSTLLAAGQEGRSRKQRRAFRILILVPPHLVTKWADEVTEERFLRYLKGWERASNTKAIYETFIHELVVLRSFRDLEKKKGISRYGRHVLPRGCYIVNSNLILRPEKKATQIHKTPWDTIVVDEAHRLSGELTNLPPNTLLAGKKTKTVLLTATPFQLSPNDLKGLLQDTFGGYGDPGKWKMPWEEANKIYNEGSFKNYRGYLNKYFKTCDTTSMKAAIRLRDQVSSKLRDRIVRTPKRDKRKYFFVDNRGLPEPIGGRLFDLDDGRLNERLMKSALIELKDKDLRFYLDVRNELAARCSKGGKEFVAGTLRQLLSTYGQFRASSFGKAFSGTIPSNGHPKLEALEGLIERIFGAQLKNRGFRKSGWLEKVLIFTTYVGAEHHDGFATNRSEHGTAYTIRRILEDRLREYFPTPKKEAQARLKDELKTLRKKSENLTRREKKNLDLRLRRFSGNRFASFLLSIPRNLSREKRYLTKQLLDIGEKIPSSETEKWRRENERRQRKIDNLIDRYATGQLVARYDGVLDQRSRDRHLRGFNAPYSPLVLIASSVGQEGIDLQRFCSHVVHYDLEWNPAKLEQREGRVDRHGREAKGPVNVYFLICRDTYDERVLHVMTNRMRWHQILLANHSRLKSDPHESDETGISARLLRRVTLDLRPRNSNRR